MSSETHPVVIVGAGQAGSELAFALRQQGYEGRILLIGDEPELPYRRPPLSKAYLSGEVTRESLLIRSQAACDKQQIECLTGVSVESIDRAAHTVRLSNGQVQAYSKLALTTGGRVRKLDAPGAQKPNVFYVRTVADIDQLKASFVAGARLLVIGGGYIGLEAAAVGIKKGLSVTIVEALPRLLARVAAPEISAFYQQAHSKRGVDIRLATSITEFIGDERVTAVRLSDGSEVALDLIVVGIGILPNTELAAAAGLAIDNGIVVNEFAQTADPDVFACGDCANHINGFLGRSVRLESVPSAQEQARTAALTLCGKPAPHAAVPWFWSDQFELKLQMVGLSQGYEQLVFRGDPATESFSAFYLKDGVIVSADAISRPQEFAVAKRLVSDRIRVSPEALADETVPLKAHLPPAAPTA